MICRLFFSRRTVLPFLLILFAGNTGHILQAQEYRGLWADAFHQGFRTREEVTQLIADARAGNFNALFVEVRRRGDALYNSSFEPKATDISPPTFDPLAELIAQAKSGSPQLQVHAWITSYLVWNRTNSLPSQANHPYRLHPDWLSRNYSGQTWDGSNYQFDPGHPEVQRHVFNVAMDLVARYRIDGLHFDYIRYSGNEWGYNAVAVSRFRARYGRLGTPTATDPLWLQFRREQVTALVRKTYLSAIALNPQIKLSAATICFAPGIATDSQWYASSAAWTDVLQDWRGWMAEGILDLNVPMNYFRHHARSVANGVPYDRATDWFNWSNFAKDHRFNRHVAIGSGAYQNHLTNVLTQFRSTRAPSPAGNRADGVVAYSYSSSALDYSFAQRGAFYAALTQPGYFEANPIFSTPTSVPEMNWKMAPFRGYLKGFITHSQTGGPLDGATVTLFGPVERIMTNDATGFYGFVELPTGNYTVTATFSNRASASGSVQIAAGTVSTLDLALGPVASFISTLRVHPGRASAIVSWTTAASASSRVEYGISTNFQWAVSLATKIPGAAALTTHHSILLSGLAPKTKYFFRVISTVGHSSYVAGNFAFSTTRDVIIDNPEASFINRKHHPGTNHPARDAIDRVYR